ncbi:MAG: aminoglycoside phosphotransferase family protein [Acidimicrobiales bacterium]
MMHDDEIEISDEMVRELIKSQFPRWATRRIWRIQSSGTVNAIFRIGDELAARLPLRPADPERTRRFLEAEAQASAAFARAAPVPAPDPVAIGVPGVRYPLPWSVQTWLPGTDAAAGDTSQSFALARDLANLISALRVIDTTGRHFEGRRWRGGDLRQHDEWVATCLSKSTRLLDVAPLAKMWTYFRGLPRPSPDVMTHGDLTPLNVLVADGRLAGVLDCGSFGPADPSLDLIAGWHLLDDGPRAVFRTQLQCDELEWERAKAWAFEQSLGAIWYYDQTNPAMSIMGRRTLGRVVAHFSR